MNMNKNLIHFVEWKKIAFADYPAVMRELKEWGITDIVAHPVWKGRITEIAAMLKTAGLKTSACHALWGEYYDLGYSEGLVAHAGFLEELVQTGVKTYTVHMALEICGWDQIRRGVDALLPVAEKSGIILALENHHESAAKQKELIAMLQQYRHSNLGICFDTGHANCYSKSVGRTLDLMREFIVTCHLHDNYGQHDDHNPPGQGAIDWERLVIALQTCPRLLHVETESGDWGRNSWLEFRRIWKY